MQRERFNLSVFHMSVYGHVRPIGRARDASEHVAAAAAVCGRSRLGRVGDLVVTLDSGDQLPPVTGLKARIGGREMFVPADRIAALEPEGTRTLTTELNLAQFERREGEVLLRGDLSGAA